MGGACNEHAVENDKWSTVQVVVTCKICESLKSVLISICSASFLFVFVQIFSCGLVWDFFNVNSFDVIILQVQQVQYTCSYDTIVLVHKW